MASSSAAGAGAAEAVSRDGWWKKPLDVLEEPPSDDEELNAPLDGGARVRAAVAAQPADMVTPLLPFQLEFLAWAQAQEHGAARGGILADEMGLGKV